MITGIANAAQAASLSTKSARDAADGCATSQENAPALVIANVAVWEETERDDRRAAVTHAGQSQQPEQARPAYDQSLKRLLARSHDDFLRLVASGYTWVGERSPELPAVARQADLVWEVTDAQGLRGLLHIELQTKPNRDMGERVAEYGIRLWLRDHVPVRSIVVFLQPAKTLPESPFVIAWGAHQALRYDYDVVQLWEIPAERVLASAAPNLWPLAAVMGNPSVEDAVRVAERIASAPVSEQERGELTSLLVALADLRLAHGQLLEALRRHPVIDEIIRQSALAEEFLAEGERRLARAALEGRFGPLSEDIVAALKTADEATLIQLVAQLSTLTLEQARGLLGLH